MDIQITKTIYTSTTPQDLEVYISVDQNVPKPTSEHHSYSMVNESSVMVTARDIVACEEYEEHKFA